MSCNCLREIEERIVKDLPVKNDVFKDIKIKSASFDDEMILLDSIALNRLLYPVTITHERIGRRTKTTINVTGKYCPFCGNRHENAKMDADDVKEDA